MPVDLVSLDEHPISTGGVKQAINDLAILGGAPAFEQKLHVGRPNIGDRARLMERITDILERRWLTNNGVYVRAFEERIAELVGAEHCIATCNGTVALEIAARALGLSGEVIVPSFTFVATAHALQWQEITPVFCDIDPQTYTLDPESVVEMITPRTSGILGVHMWGRPCDVDALAEIASNRNVKLFFDASHAFGCSYKGKMIGSFGSAEIFSFHATKFVNAFEGGAVVTNDGALASKIRLMKNFGFSGIDDVSWVGTNGKMSEVSAAMGLTSLEACHRFIDDNYQKYKEYERELAALSGVRLLRYDEREHCNYQYIVLEIDETITQLPRDILLDVLWAENVLARRYFFPGCHQMEPYRSYFPHAGLLLPHTERLSNRVICLPTGNAVSNAAIREICQIIRLACGEASVLLDRMRKAPACQMPYYGALQKSRK